MTITMQLKRASSALVIGAILSLAAPAHAKDDQLFKDLGGKPGIDKIVGDLMPMIMADARINKFFEKVDMKKLGGLLSEQFCELSGGPCVYSGRDMVISHDEMGVRTSHFNALAENLQVAMERNNVPAAASNKLVAMLAPMHKAMVRKVEPAQQ
ncbi:MAG: group 1 truncated hemoglobin [Pseudomonadota bacterium]